MRGLTTIDRRAVVPLYVQLEQLIRADIAERGLGAGDKLPSESELCANYDVSRTVVRQALLELERAGVIYKEKGRGTFVGETRSARGIGGALVGTFEDIQIAGEDQRSHVLRREVIPATAQVARDLQLREGSDVVEIERSRSVDGVPWAFTRTQLPLDVGVHLLDIELEDVSLFGVLEKRFGIQFDRAVRTVEADLANEVIAAALGVAVASPVLVMRSLSFDQTRRPIERFTGFHRGDRSRLDIEVQHAP
jgi:GntR family transcriptional regulator